MTEARTQSGCQFGPSAHDDVEAEMAAVLGKTVHQGSNVEVMCEPQAETSKESNAHSEGMQSGFARLVSATLPTSWPVTMAVVLGKKIHQGNNVEAKCEPKAETSKESNAHSDGMQSGFARLVYATLPTAWPVTNWGVFLESEYHHTHILHCFQIQVIFFGTFAFIRYVNIDLSLITEPTLKSVFRELTRFIISFVAIALQWPMLQLNYAKFRMERTAGLAFFMCVGVAGFAYLSVKVSWNGFVTYTMMSFYALSLLMTFFLGLFCVFDGSVGPGQFAARVGAARRQRVNFLVRHARRCGLRTKDASAGILMCFDGSKHRTITELMRHVSENIGISRKDLLTKPPGYWTMAETSRRCAETAPPSEPGVQLPNLVDATLDYLMPWRGLPPGVKLVDKGGCMVNPGRLEKDDYGDACFFYPAKFVHIVMSMLGIVILAFVAGIRTASDFTEVLGNTTKGLETCESGNRYCSHLVLMDGWDMIGSSPLKSSVEAAMYALFNGTNVSNSSQIDEIRAELQILVDRISNSSAGKLSDVYPSSSYVTKRMVSKLGGIQWFGPAVWRPAGLLLLHVSLKQVSQSQYSSWLNFASSAHLVQNKEQLENEIMAALENNQHCVDMVESAYYLQPMPGDCENVCGLLQTASNPDQFAYFGSCKFYDELKAPALAGVITGYSFGVFFALESLLQLVVAYKKKVLQIRRGAATFVHSMSAFKPQNSVYLLGALISCFVFGILLCTGVVGFVVFVFVWEPSRTWLWEQRSLWLSLVVPTLVLLAWQLPMWSQVVDKKGNLTRPKTFSLLSMAMIISYIPAATLQSILRVVYLLIFIVVGIMRCDQTLFPSALVGMDKCFASFMATVANHEQYHNPCANVFAELLLAGSDIVAVQRGAKSQGLNKWRTVRNRWHLAVLLAANPSLMQYRDRRPRDLWGEIEVVTPCATKSLSRDVLFPSSPRYERFESIND